MQRINILIKILLSGVILLPISAQAFLLDSYQGAWWINGGIGASAGFEMNSEDEQFDLEGAALELSANYILSAHQLITARKLYAGDILFDSFDELAGLYGLIYKTDLSYVSAGAGLGYAKLNKDFQSKSGDRDISTFGVPVEIQAFITPTPVFGFGLVLFANFNNQASIGGILASVQLGVLK